MQVVTIRVITSCKPCVEKHDTYNYSLCQKKRAIVLLVSVYMYILWRAHPALVKLGTERVSSRLGAMATLWRPRPAGTRQYIAFRFMWFTCEGTTTLSHI